MPVPTEVLDDDEPYLVLGGSTSEFEFALIGFARPWPHRKKTAVYAVDKIIEHFVDQGSSYEEAVEHFDFNVAGGYHGDQTPIFVSREEP